MTASGWCPPRPQVSFDDGNALQSDTFGDIYFQREDGLAESRFTFTDPVLGPAPGKGRTASGSAETGDDDAQALSAAPLGSAPRPARQQTDEGWPQDWQDRRQITLLETGFGTGLNFLAAAERFLAAAPSACRLQYIGIEAFPLDADQLTRALSAWPELSELSARLTGRPPARLSGFHQVFFHPRIDLMLIYLPLADALPQLAGPVDGIFLDGFAPSKNPEMWTAEAAQHLGRIAAPDARLATFTAAGFVRRQLVDAGFEMRKAPGFGRKRERLLGHFIGVPSVNDPAAVERAQAAAALQSDRPSAARGTGVTVAHGNRPARRPRLHILGAGLAGSAVAYFARQAGFSCELIDPHGPGFGASGNPLALISPRYGLTPDAHARFRAQSWLFASAFYRAHDLWHSRITEQAPGRALPREKLQALRSSGFPPDYLSFHDGHLVCERAGTVVPDDVLAFLRGDQPVLPEPSSEADILIDCRGAWSAEACGPCAAQPGIRPNRGQLTVFSALWEDVATSRNGYIAALDETRIVAGATYDRDIRLSDDWQALRAADHAENRAKGAEILNGLEVAPVLSGRASLRATTPDHLPVMGLLTYSDRITGRAEDGSVAGNASAERARDQRASDHPQKAVLTGLGSRGFSEGLILAAQLIAGITGHQGPLPPELQALVSPARKALKR